MLDILVIGALNADFVVRVPHFPAPGESISGGDLAIIPGGKGANQAVAAAKLGAKTALLGCVGQDQLGAMLIDNLAKFNIATNSVHTSSSATGTAFIVLDDTGQNSIVFSAGANRNVTIEDVSRYFSEFEGAKYLLLQLEIPLDVVIFAARTARAHGIKVILNPAPAMALPPELLINVDFLMPNETELSILSGSEIYDLESIQAAAGKLLNQGNFDVVVTMGGKGALYVSQDKILHVDAFTVPVLDTTAAGDAFIAGFAVSMARGSQISASLRFAWACGALAVTKFGAQPSLPFALEVEEFLGRNLRVE